MEWPESLPLAAWIALHLGGIAAACLSRFSLGARTDTALQLIVMTGFISVALAAVMAGAQGGDQLRLSVLSGTTLGAMVVAAVFDPQKGVPDPLLTRFAALDE